ncbi:Hypothetical protein NTJ_14899 [Nesidiocoris tenuis]|uniref:BHLH domain-containing protein n=1 Tax=Nesidiocoris tenuis TaxID=355587 RepID=A0ABN7BCI3_9HEMI|nr:Hypothetical protein NTJ_14899 [Nesidiocoris tenuis]
MPSAPVSAKLIPREEEIIRRLFRALRRGIRELLGEMSASRRRSVCDRLLSIMDQLELLLMGPNQLPQRAP